MTLDGTPGLSDMFANNLATYCVLRSRLDRDDLVEEEVACAYRASHRTAMERGCATRGIYPAFPSTGGERGEERISFNGTAGKESKNLPISQPEHWPKGSTKGPPNRINNILHGNDPTRCGGDLTPHYETYSSSEQQPSRIGTRNIISQSTSAATGWSGEQQRHIYEKDSSVSPYSCRASVRGHGKCNVYEKETDRGGGWRQPPHSGYRPPGSTTVRGNTDISTSFQTAAEVYGASNPVLSSTERNNNVCGTNSPPPSDRLPNSSVVSVDLALKYHGGLAIPLELPAVVEFANRVVQEVVGVVRASRLLREIKWMTKVAIAKKTNFVQLFRVLLYLRRQT
eukprot:314458_1